MSQQQQPSGRDEALSVIDQWVEDLLTEGVVKIYQDANGVRYQVTNRGSKELGVKEGDLLTRHDLLGLHGVT